MFNIEGVIKQFFFRFIDQKKDKLIKKRVYDITIIRAAVKNIINNNNNKIQNI